MLEHYSQHFDTVETQQHLLQTSQPSESFKMARLHTAALPLRSEREPLPNSHEEAPRRPGWPQAISRFSRDSRTEARPHSVPTSSKLENRPRPSWRLPQASAAPPSPYLRISRPHLRNSRQTQLRLLHVRFGRLYLADSKPLPILPTSACTARGASIKTALRMPL